jgi:DNA anti-recombination protein RmuC
MRGIIDNVIAPYEMRAEVLGVLVANIEEALRAESAGDRESKADEQAKKLEDILKDLTIDVNSMLTRFWFQKERHDRKNESMSDEQVKNIADFAGFTKTLTENVRSLQRQLDGINGQTFERKLDEEIEQIERCVKKKLKEFDEALKETRPGLGNTWKKRLKQYAGKGL